MELQSVIFEIESAMKYSGEMRTFRVLFTAMPVTPSPGVYVVEFGEVPRIDDRPGKLEFLICNCFCWGNDFQQKAEALVHAYCNVPGDALPAGFDQSPEQIILTNYTK